MRLLYNVHQGSFLPKQHDHFCKIDLFDLCVKLGPRFYRSGWPEERFKFAPGSTAMLRCDHIGYAGDAKKAPPAFMTWFKDGKLIKSLPGKVNFFVFF